MKRIEEMERRLLNWARCVLGDRAGGMGFATVDLTLANADRSENRESVIPRDEVEARVTAEGILTLEDDLRRAVQAFYLSGGGHELIAKRLAISKATMYERVARSHHKLQAWLADRERRLVEQRKRLERIQASARP